MKKENEAIILESISALQITINKLNDAQRITFDEWNRMRCCLGTIRNNVQSLEKVEPKPIPSIEDLLIEANATNCTSWYQLYYHSHPLVCRLIKSLALGKGYTCSGEGIDTVFRDNLEKVKDKPYSLTIIIPETFEGTLEQWEESFFMFPKPLTIGDKVSQILSFCEKMQWDVEIRYGRA